MQCPHVGPAFSGDGASDERRDVVASSSPNYLEDSEQSSTHRGESEVERSQMKNIDSQNSLSISGSGLPVIFEAVTYSVGRKKKAKLILHGVSGYFESSTLTALMGPSGSGKTSLLDIIAGRKTTGRLSGQVKFAGRKPTRAFLRRYAAYVEQFDNLVHNLTVYEMLLYTAELKNPWRSSLDENKARVDDIIRALGLEGCANTIIGSSLNRGISGGQLKRCNIGTALVSSPLVLFLDEPTSGLDSVAAEEVTLTLRGLADQGLTVCSTIHAPSTSVYNLFDRLLILLDGRVVFFGKTHEAVPYFSGVAQSRPTHTPSYSDAEWTTKLIVGAGREGRSEELAVKFRSHQLSREVDNRRKFLACSTSFKEIETLKLLNTKKAVGNPNWWTIKILLKYRMKADYKSPLFWCARIVDKAIFAFIIGSLYWGVGQGANQEDVQNSSAALFMWALLPSFASITFLPAFILERVLYVRERNDGLYTPLAYLLHKMIEEVIVIAIISIIFSVTVWFAVSFLGSFLLFFLVYFVTTCVGVALGYCISAIAPSMEVAQVATAGYAVVLLFFAGLLMRLDDIPSYWYWFSVIDFIRYGWGALMVNQFEDLPEAEWPLVLVNPLQYLGLDGVNKWAYLGYESIFIVVFGLGAWLALTFMPYGRR